MGTETGPPKQIWYSLSAFLGTIVVVLIFLVFSAFRYGMKLDRSETMISLLEAAIIVLLMLLMLRRKKWARTVYTVLTGLAIFCVGVAMLAALAGFGPAKRAIPMGVYNLTALSLQVLLRLVSVYFLYVSPSRKWFRGPIAEDNAPQDETEESTRSSSSSSGVMQNVAAPSHATCLPAPTSVCETAVATSAQSGQVSMKKAVLLAGVLVLSIPLVIVCIHNRRQAPEVEAIRSALSADVTLSREVFGNRSMRDSDVKAIEAYAQGLRRIDMSCCLRDFQMAYLEHIQAWESLARSRASVDFLRPLFDLFVLKQIPDLPDDEQPIHDEIARTWDRIERIALSYGVRVPQ